MYPIRLIVMLSLLLCFLTGSAQDVILFLDGSSQLGKVVEITDTEVKYRKADNPTGPLYTVKVSDLMRINYENGEADLFIQEEATPSTTTPAAVFSGVTGDLKDTQLMNLYNNGKNVNFSLPKKLRLIGIIGGSALIAGGLAMIIGNNFYDYNNDLLIVGACITGLGVLTIPTFCIIAHHKQKQLESLYELSSAPLYRQEIFSKDGKSLSMGVDYMADRAQTRTLGLGMTFNF